MRPGGCRQAPALPERRHLVSIFGHWRGPRHAVPRNMPCAPSTYRPRDAEHTVLHAVIREHLETFLREATARGKGSGLPRFVEQELKILAHLGHSQLGRSPGPAPPASGAAAP